MSPLVAIGSAIVVNVGVLVGGVIWLRRQMRRVVAARRAQEPSAAGSEVCAARERSDQTPI